MTTQAAASGAPSASPSPSSAPSAPSAASTTTSAPSVPSGGTSSAPPASGSGGGDPGATKLGDGNAQQAGQTAADAAAKEAARKMKLKINGRELELDEPEVIRRAQLASAADEKFREAAELRKQTEQFWETFLKDPKSVLLHPELRDRINFRQLAEEFLGSELQKEMMTPEQRELEDLRQWKKQQDEVAETTKREQMTRAQQEEMTKLQHRAAAEYDKKITDVLAQSNLPKTAYTVKRVAELLHGALTKGYDLDVQTAVDMVRDGYMSDLQSLVGGLEGESLVKVLGDDIIKRLRKFDLTRIKAQLEESATPTPQPVAASAAAAPQRNEQGQFLRPDEWKEAIRKKAGF